MKLKINMKLHCCYYCYITVIYRITSDQIIQWTQTVSSQFVKHFIALLYMLTKEHTSESDASFLDLCRHLKHSHSTC